MTRFELAPPATRTRCATRLRYIPIILVPHLDNIVIYLIVNRKIFILLRCATPLTNRYLIDLFGRVLHPDNTLHI